MIKNGVYRLKKTSSIDSRLEFQKGTEFEIVSGMLYINGLPITIQETIMKWIKGNHTLFIKDTRDF